MKSFREILSAGVAAVLATTLVSAGAAAGTRVSVGSMTVDGVEVRDLVCDLEDGGMFAVMAVVGALAKQKKKLDACAPAGAAFQTAWTWEGGKTAAVEVRRSSLPAKDACIAKALKAAGSGPTGRCEALVLAGKPKAARKAAEELARAAAPKAAPPEEPAPAKVAPEEPASTPRKGNRGN